MKVATKSISLYALMLVLLGIIPFLASCSSRSPVGTYRADLTIAQSGAYTTIVLKSSGACEMTQKGYDTEYTYWDYAGKGIDVRIKQEGTGSHYFMDFDEMQIYYGSQNYRTSREGHKFTKIN